MQHIDKILLEICFVVPLNTAKYLRRFSFHAFLRESGQLMWHVRVKAKVSIIDFILKLMSEEF